MATVLKLHGRSAFRAKITFKDTTTGALVDLSSKAIVFETDGAKFRKALDAGDVPTVRVLHLTRAEVDQLPTSTTDFAIIDETVEGGESVLGEGQLKRVGWIKP